MAFQSMELLFTPIIQVRILAEIEVRTAQNIAGIFQVMGGTSSGSIISALLAQSDNNAPKYTANSVLNFFMNDYKNIFPKGDGFMPKILPKKDGGYGWMPKIVP